MQPIIWWVGAALVAALIIWLLSQIPMDPTLHRIIRAVVIFIVVAWLISAVWAVVFGVPLLPLGHRI